LLAVLERETDDLLITRLLEDLGEIYWRFLDTGRRGFAAGPVERVLRVRSRTPDRPAFWLGALARCATTPESVAELESIWQNGMTTDGRLPENLSTQLVLAVALHRPQQADALLGEQIERIRDPDRRDRIEFMRPALSPDDAERDAFFRRLLAGEGRGRWRTAAAGLLNHPLRADSALHYLVPGMHYAAELRSRGEIFLPRQWLTALFNGHASTEAATRIRGFLKSAAPPEPLRQLILQTADPVFRSARWTCR
jgi:aminopeptidase N